MPHSKGGWYGDREQHREVQMRARERKYQTMCRKARERRQRFVREFNEGDGSTVLWMALQALVVNLVYYPVAIILLVLFIVAYPFIWAYQHTLGGARDE